MSDLVHMMAPRTSVLNMYKCVLESQDFPASIMQDDKMQGLAACLVTSDDPPQGSPPSGMMTVEYAAADRLRREERAAELLVRRRRWQRMDVNEKSTRESG